MDKNARAQAISYNNPFKQGKETETQETHEEPGMEKPEPEHIIVKS